MANVIWFCDVRRKTSIGGTGGFVVLLESIF